MQKRRKNNMIVFRISSQYFVAGGTLRGKHVFRCAPIIKYMKGWSLEKLRIYCKRKGWELGLDGGKDNVSR